MPIQVTEQVSIETSHGMAGSTHYVRARGRVYDPALPAVVTLHGWPDAETWQDNLAGFVSGIYGGVFGSQLAGILAAGYTVYAPFTGSCWGTNVVSPATGGTGRDAITDCLTQALADGHPGIHLLGASHGGCVALNWAWRNPTDFGGCYLLAPATVLTPIHAAPAYGSSIDASFGTPFATTKLAFDPIDNVASIAPIADRIVAFSSQDDPIIDWANLVAFGAASGVTIVDSGGGSHFPTSSSSANWDDVAPVRLYAAHS